MTLTLLLLLSTLTWVVGAFISANPRIHKDFLTASGMQMLCGGTVMMVSQYALSLFTGNYPQFHAFSMRSALALGGEALHKSTLLALPLVVVSVILMIWEKPGKNP